MKKYLNAFHGFQLKESDHHLTHIRAKKIIKEPLSSSRLFFSKNENKNFFLFLLNQEKPILRSRAHLNSSYRTGDCTIKALLGGYSQYLAFFVT
jgi:hypothetical protein